MAECSRCWMALAVNKLQYPIYQPWTCSKKKKKKSSYKYGCKEKCSLMYRLGKHFLCGDTDLTLTTKVTAFSEASGYCCRNNSAGDVISLLREPGEVILQCLGFFFFFLKSTCPAWEPGVTAQLLAHGSLFQRWMQKDLTTKHRASSSPGAQTWNLISIGGDWNVFLAKQVSEKEGKTHW